MSSSFRQLVSIAMWRADDQVQCQAEQALLRDNRTSSSAVAATSETLVYNAAGRAFASGYDTDSVYQY